VANDHFFTPVNMKLLQRDKGSIRMMRLNSSCECICYNFEFLTRLHSKSAHPTHASMKMWKHELLSDDVDLPSDEELLK
jgi:hypothetical protein